MNPLLVPVAVILLVCCLGFILRAFQAVHYDCRQEMEALQHLSDLSAVPENEPVVRVDAYSDRARRLEGGGW
jgi:hypothetical protein